MTNIQKVLDEFECFYPEAFEKEQEDFLNNAYARILKVGERYHTSIIISRNHTGAMKILAENDYIKKRILDESEEIMEEELADLVARLILFKITQEV